MIGNVRSVYLGGDDALMAYERAQLVMKWVARFMLVVIFLFYLWFFRDLYEDLPRETIAKVLIAVALYVAATEGIQLITPMPLRNSRVYGMILRAFGLAILGGIVALILRS